MAVDQQVSPILAGHADHPRNGVENAQQHFVRLPQPVLAALAVTCATVRRRTIRAAAGTIAMRRQLAARTQPKIAMIDRQQQVVGSAGLAGALQIIEILFGADHDDRHLGAPLDPVQLMNKAGGLALSGRGGEHDEAGAVLAAERQRGLGIVEGLRDGPAAERIGEPFKNFQVSGAVIDDDDQLRRHGETQGCGVACNFKQAALNAICGCAAA